MEEREAFKRYIIENLEKIYVEFKYNVIHLEHIYESSFASLACGRKTFEVFYSEEEKYKPGDCILFRCRNDKNEIIGNDVYFQIGATVQSKVDGRKIQTIASLLKINIPNLGF